MEKLKVTPQSRETADSNLLDDYVERIAVVAATPANAPCLAPCTVNSTVDIHLPQNLINDVIIKHSSTPECWRTVPNELKPSHQALLLGYNFRPTPRYAL